MYQYKYCPICANELVEKIPEGDEKPRKVCGKCGFVWYDNPVPACGVLITDGNGKVLMARRKYPPRVGGWTLPAGFMEPGEGPDECAIRETLEETGLKVKLNGVLNAYKGGDDPRSRVVLIIYLAEIISGEMRPSDDVSELAYFDLDNPPDNIAFNSHIKALAEYKENHRG
jgi:8-oxo-dGTP diphosphatase